MARFSSTSRTKLETCHPDIQRVFFEVVKHIDCTVLEGVRDIETQRRYVAEGRSKTMNSKHLPQADELSHAVDVAPYPVDWNDKERFNRFAFFVMGVAAGLGVRLRWGGDWDSDKDLTDQSFYDGPHFELIE